MKNLIAISSLALLFSCTNQSGDKSITQVSETKVSAASDASTPSSKEKDGGATPSGPVADASAIMARKQVPVICYHHIKDMAVIPNNGAGYSVTLTTFKSQLKALADSGYQTITPDQYYNYLAFGKALPAKPVMLTYDDTDEEQFTLAKPEMDKYGFKGTYFIMTISIGRPRYMSAAQIKQLSDEGHTIACHTWDHHRTDRYVVGDRQEMVGNKMKTVNDWDMQLVKPRARLEEITGKKIEYFAYPFGLWNEAGIPEIKNRDYKLAFQLSTKRDSLQPLYTVRRIIAAPQWDDAKLIRVMNNSFR